MSDFRTECKHEVQVNPINTLIWGWGWGKIHGQSLYIDDDYGFKPLYNGNYQIQYNWKIDFEVTFGGVPGVYAMAAEVAYVKIWVEGNLWDMTNHRLVASYNLIQSVYSETLSGTGIYFHEDGVRNAQLTMTYPLLNTRTYGFWTILHTEIYLKAAGPWGLGVIQLDMADESNAAYLQYCQAQYVGPS
jgi:hypothetical protein